MAAETPFQARCLLRAATRAALATQGGDFPHVALVTPACAPDGLPLLLLSSLAQHTRRLLADPRCALLVEGADTGPNPQTTPRLTLSGTAEQVVGAELAGLTQRWLHRHPYAAPYAGFGDFSLWRIQPEAALLVGGFARAAKLAGALLRPDAAIVAALAAAEPTWLAHLNACPQLAGVAQGAITPLAHAPNAPNLGHAESPAAMPWRVVGLDVDGLDLCAGERVARLPFAAALQSVDMLPSALAGLGLHEA